MAPEGVIIGGWNFVIAAYAITSAMFLLYAWSLRSRLKKAEDKNDDEQTE